MRSARRRHPVLSRMRSRCELTVRTLMYSWPAICASVCPRATRVTSSRSRGLSAFQARCRGRRLRARGGEHEDVLGRGGQAHRLAAFLGRLRLSRPERLPGFAQGFLPLEPALGQIRMQRGREPLAPLERDHRGPYRDGLGGAPGPGAQVPAAVQVLEQPCRVRRSAGRSGGLPASARRRPRNGPRSGREPPSSPAGSPDSTGRPRPGRRPAQRRTSARQRPGRRPLSARSSGCGRTPGPSGRAGRPRCAPPAGPAARRRRGRRRHRRPG